MSKRDDMIAALEKRIPSTAVPVWEIEFHLWDKFASDGKIMLGKELDALSPAAQDKALHKNAEIIVSVAKQLNFAAVTTPVHYWEQAPGHPAYYWMSEQLRFKQINILKEMAGDDFMLIGIAGIVMTMPGAENYMEFSYKLFDSPDEIEDMAQKKFDEGIEISKRLIDCGVEAICSPSDIADNHGVFFNIEQMERFVMPYMQKWGEQMRQDGIYSILHTDGNLNAVIDMIADSGIDALQAIDPTADMDMLKTKTQVDGRLCLCGNVDCGLALMGTSAQVYESTKQLLQECKASGGLVLGASNAVQAETSTENYEAIIRAWQDYGQY